MRLQCRELLYDLNFGWQVSVPFEFIRPNKQLLKTAIYSLNTSFMKQMLWWKGVVRPPEEVLRLLKKSTGHNTLSLKHLKVWHMDKDGHLWKVTHLVRSHRLKCDEKLISYYLKLQPRTPSALWPGAARGVATAHLTSLRENKMWLNIWKLKPGELLVMKNIRCYIIHRGQCSPGWQCKRWRHAQRSREVPTQHGRLCPQHGRVCPTALLCVC